jgi:hypothetical protein
MKIHPQVIVSPDRPTVIFREPFDKVDLAVEIPKVINRELWGCGTYFNVQFVSHDRSKLLYSGMFVVTEELETIAVNEDDPYQPVTRSRARRKAACVGDWWVGEKSEVQWNAGLKVHQVRAGGKVIFESPDKEQAKAMARSANRPSM